MDFADYLSNLIKNKKYSYRQLAMLADIDHSYISKMINGKAGIPSPDILKKLAKPLGISYEELMKAAGYLCEKGPDQVSLHSYPFVRDTPLNYNDPTEKIKAAITSDPELAEFWEEISQREDLQLMFKQARDLTPQSIKKVIRIIKAIEDEEADE
ncbi:helix-turn-helix domain-containing protein [Desulfosporosinus lacus]|uniref:Helix-turn-helix n=1 Tax=Desulfosporosinus lacus DSM 15449 TaxID=1121420 RepID=A0A1M5Q4S7_9FIRM|nr:helix-turn-helix transcriptional regulator [Desulfosporosinus lacus]SHH09095.1 Helix-turn-helix [Desulfosporosinus lacus DSM 15449]